MRCSASFLLRAVGDAGSGRAHGHRRSAGRRRPGPTPNRWRSWTSSGHSGCAWSWRRRWSRGAGWRPGATSRRAWCRDRAGPGHARPAQPARPRLPPPARSCGGPCRWSRWRWRGALANSIEEFTKDNESLQDVLARSGSERHRRLPLDHAALLGPDRRRRGAAGHHPAADRGDRAPGRHRAGHAGRGRAGPVATSRRRSPPAGSPSWPVDWGSGPPTGSWSATPGRSCGSSARRSCTCRRVAAGLAVALLGAAPRWVAAAWDLGGVPRARPVRHPDRGPRGGISRRSRRSRRCRRSRCTWCRSASWPRSPWRSWRPASPPSAAATSADGDRGGLRSATGPTLGSST